MLIYKSPAKINLTLEILNRRKDGYHNIATIIQTVNMFDLITYEHYKNILVLSDIKELKQEENIVFKAANIVKNEFSIKQGVKINLTKNISKILTLIYKMQLKIMNCL